MPKHASRRTPAFQLTPPFDPLAPGVYRCTTIWLVMLSFACSEKTNLPGPPRYCYGVCFIERGTPVLLALPQCLVLGCARRRGLSRFVKPSGFFFCVQYKRRPLPLSMGMFILCVSLQPSKRWGCSSSEERCSLTSWWTGPAGDRCSSRAPPWSRSSSYSWVRSRAMYRMRHKARLFRKE